MKDFNYLIAPKLNNNSLSDKFKHNWRCKCPDCEATWQELLAEYKESLNNA